MHQILLVSINSCLTARPPPTQNLYFWNDSFEETGAGEGKSKTNVQQAKRAVALMRYIVQQGYNPGR